MGERRARRIAVVGAGPIGLEAAVCGVELGHRVRVYERGSVAHNVRQWGHVRLFSSWAFERSEPTARRLARTGVELDSAEAYPTGSEYVERYCEPVARRLLAGRIAEHTRVVAVGREGLGKGGAMGADRARRPFRILLEHGGSERIEHADVVLDCSGTYGNPNWLGSGNIPAIGERELRDRIASSLEDFSGARAARYRGRHVLVVGSGHSAATALEALLGLDGVRLTWLARTASAKPYEPIDDDPLPERSRLGGHANDLASAIDPRVRYVPAASVQEVSPRGEGFVVRVQHGGGPETIGCDRIVALVGYGPDRSIHEELQLHECYASFAPMKLAAALLQTASADCLALGPQGAETLVNPEPGFFVLGAKSHGRGSAFLIRTGLEQVRQAYTLIEGREVSI